MTWNVSCCWIIFIRRTNKAPSGTFWNILEHSWHGCDDIKPGDDTISSQASYCNFRKHSLRSSDEHSGQTHCACTKVWREIICKRFVYWAFTILCIKGISFVFFHHYTKRITSSAIIWQTAFSSDAESYPFVDDTKNEQGSFWNILEHSLYRCHDMKPGVSFLLPIHIRSLMIRWTNKVPTGTFRTWLW